MSGYDDAKQAHAAAVHAYRSLDTDSVHLHVHGLSKITDKPVERRTGALLLDGLRMGMVLACETLNHDLVEHYYDEIVKLANRPIGGPDGPSVIPFGKAARHWAKGWKFEVQEDHSAALGLRQFQCQRLRDRAAELRRKRPWIFGERTEAILLVDLFTDMVRSLRRCRPPIGNFGAVRGQLGEDLHSNEFIRLSEDSRMLFLSRRRAKMRVACEIADRQQAGADDADARRNLRKKLLADPSLVDTAVSGDSARAQLDFEAGSPIAQLDSELFEMEKALAWKGTYPDIEATCDKHCEGFRKIGFTRRAQSLAAHRLLIPLHGA